MSSIITTTSGFGKPASDTCGICDTHKARGTTNSKHYVRHRLFKKLARAAFQKDQKCNPEEKADQAWCIDLGSVDYVPQISSGEVFYRNQLSLYPCFMYNLKTGKCYIIVWDETVAGRGPEEICSSIWKVLQAEGMSEGGVAGPRISLWFDNCGGQNKSQHNAFFASWLVDRKVCSEVTISFLEIGDTFNPCDQSAGMTERAGKSRKTIETIEEMYGIPETARVHPSPFRIIRMARTDFLAWKALSQTTLSLLGRVDNNQNVLSFTSTRHWKFTSESPRKFRFRYTFLVNEPYKSVDMDRNRQRACSMPYSSDLRAIRTDARPVSKRKYADLVYLCRFLQKKKPCILPEHRAFRYG